MKNIVATILVIVGVAFLFSDAMARERYNQGVSVQIYTGNTGMYYHHGKEKNRHRNDDDRDNDRHRRKHRRDDHRRDRYRQEPGVTIIIPIPVPVPLYSPPPYYPNARQAPRYYSREIPPGINRMEVRPEINSRAIQIWYPCKGCRGQVNLLFPDQYSLDAWVMDQNPSIKTLTYWAHQQKVERCQQGGWGQQWYSF